MPKHFIAYIQQSRMTDWKRLSLRNGKNKRVRPWVYGFNDPGLADALTEDSVLWVIGAFNVGIGKKPKRALPPMLVAKLVIDRVTSIETISKQKLKNGWLEKRPFPFNHRYQAWSVEPIAGCVPQSMFYPGNDVFEQLKTARFAPKKNKEVSWALVDKIPNDAPTNTWQERAQTWRDHCSGRFQQARQLIKGREQLTEFAERVARRSVFLSYKHLDHKPTRKHSAVGTWNEPVDFAMALIGCNLFPWLDRIAMPSSRALSKAISDQNARDSLHLLLNEGLSNVSALIAISTENYASKSPGSDRNWTEDEWLHNSAHFVWKRQQPKNCKVQFSADECTTRPSYSDVAADAVAWYERVVGES